MGLTNLDTALLDMIPSDCKLCIERSMYNGLRPMACIGPGCQKNGDGNPMHCPYWIEDKEE